MSFKGKTYSRKGGGGKGGGNPFDRMMKEQCNKPVAAKSAGIVGKWGQTSYTSLRGGGSGEGGGQAAAGQVAPVPRAKPRFFKSRADTGSTSDSPSSTTTSQESGMEDQSSLVTVAAAKIVATAPTTTSLGSHQPSAQSKKFFRARNREIETEGAGSSGQAGTGIIGEGEAKQGQPAPIAVPPPPRARPNRPAQRSSESSRSPVARSPVHQAASPPAHEPPAPLPLPVRRARKKKIEATEGRPAESARDRAEKLMAMMAKQDSEEEKIDKSIKQGGPLPKAPKQDVDEVKIERRVKPGRPPKSAKQDIQEEKIEKSGKPGRPPKAGKTVKAIKEDTPTDNNVTQPVKSSLDRESTNANLKNLPPKFCEEEKSELTSRVSSRGAAVKEKERVLQVADSDKTFRKQSEVAVPDKHMRKQSEVAVPDVVKQSELAVQEKHKREPDVSNRGRGEREKEPDVASRAVHRREFNVDSGGGVGGHEVVGKGSGRVPAKVSKSGEYEPEYSSRGKEADKVSGRETAKTRRGGEKSESSIRDKEKEPENSSRGSIRERENKSGRGEKQPENRIIGIGRESKNKFPEDEKESKIRIEGSGKDPELRSVDSRKPFLNISEECSQEPEDLSKAHVRKPENLSKGDVREKEKPSTVVKEPGNIKGLVRENEKSLKVVDEPQNLKVSGREPEYLSRREARVPDPRVPTVPPPTTQGPVQAPEVTIKGGAGRGGVGSRGTGRGGGNKRKLDHVEHTAPAAMPPIKLKLSLSRSPTKDQASSSYSVVGGRAEDTEDTESQSSTASSTVQSHFSDTASDKTDLSNGFSRHHVPTSAAPFSPSKGHPVFESTSDLELLNEDFAGGDDHSDAESDITFSPPARKIAKNMEAVKKLSEEKKSDPPPPDIKKQEKVEKQFTSAKQKKKTKEDEVIHNPPPVRKTTRKIAAKEKEVNPSESDADTDPMDDEEEEIMRKVKPSKRVLGNPSKQTGCTVPEPAPKHREEPMAPIPVPPTPTISTFDQARSTQPPPREQTARKPFSPVQPFPSPRAPSPDFEMNFPARITSVPVKEAKKSSATYKKSIFKSRSKKTPVDTPPVAPPPTSPPRVPPIASSESILERVPSFIERIPPITERVPPIMEHVPSVKERVPPTKEVPQIKERVPSILEKVPPIKEQVPPIMERVPPIINPYKSTDSVSSQRTSSPPPPVDSLSDMESMELDFPNIKQRPSASRPKKTFFRSRGKVKESDSSQESTNPSQPHPPSEVPPSKPVKISLTPSKVQQLTSDYESSQEPPLVLSKSPSLSLRSPSPDQIVFPARISAPPPKGVSAAPVVGKKPLKRSIFKSKAKENTAPPKKALSLYKHKMGWGGDKEELSKLNKDEEGPETVQQTSQPAAVSEFDEFNEFDSETAPAESDLSFAQNKLKRVATYPTNTTGLDEEGDLVTQVKCPKSYKEYFTVIKNVKKAHEMNDLGEYQEFNDDVEYISDGMKARNSVAARCLAAISLAQKAMKPHFRMHLRAHGEVSKFFVELKDAPSNPSLALCTSTILFVLSQDRLNMDMDRDSLELMLNLLDTDCNIKNALEGSGLHGGELAKNKQKVIDICTEMKAKGHAGSLNIDMISADHLAMETLLSMTSKRAGEWFKEELRELGGLGHLARTLTDCVSYLTVKEITCWTEMLTDKLKKANRILRVLENVSHENEENCGYLIEYGGPGGKVEDREQEEFLDVLQRLFKLLDEEVQLNPTTDLSDKESVGVILRDTLFSVVRVHINVVHDYRGKAYGSLHVGHKQGCMGRVLRCLFIMPYWFCPLGKRFEALVLALTLLINMVEHCDENRQALMDSMAAQKDSSFCVKEEPRMAIEDLVQLFVDRDTLAKMSEEKTDNILDCVDEEVQEIDPREDPSKESAKPTLDDTVQKLIGKAGNHMESTLIAAYVGLVIGYLIKNSDDYEQRIREYLPNGDFKAVVAVLTKLHNFMKMTAIGTVSGTKGLKATEKIIKHLEKIDAEPEEEEENDENADFSLFDVSKDDTTLIDNNQDFASTSYSFGDWGKL